MLIAESNIGYYRVCISQYAGPWYYGDIAPLTGAKMSSIFNRLCSGDVIYVGF